MSKRRPNRYSSDYAHREYGIRNWFRLVDIIDRKHQDAMIGMFLEDFNFSQKYSGTNRMNTAFIENRWQKFTQYVQKNYKLWLNHTPPTLTPSNRNI